MKTVQHTLRCMLRGREAGTGRAPSCTQKKNDPGTASKLVNTKLNGYWLRSVDSLELHLIQIENWGVKFGDTLSLYPNRILRQMKTMTALCIIH